MARMPRTPMITPTMIAACVLLLVGWCRGRPDERGCVGCIASDSRNIEAAQSGIESGGMTFAFEKSILRAQCVSGELCVTASRAYKRDHPRRKEYVAGWFDATTQLNTSSRS